MAPLCHHCQCASALPDPAPGTSAAARSEMLAAVAAAEVEKLAERTGMNYEQKGT